MIDKQNSEIIRLLSYDNRQNQNRRLNNTFVHVIIQSGVQLRYAFHGIS